MRKLKTGLRIIFAFLAGLVGSLALAFLVGYFGLTPIFRAFIVLSGSMAPAVKVGSVAITIPSANYLENDIVSFAIGNDKKNIVTHRIIVKEYPDGLQKPPIFLTAGDANKNFDAGKIKEDQIIGKVVFAVPYLGYFACFVKQPYGFILFVIIPATIIVYEELKSLKKEAWEFYRKIRVKKQEGDIQGRSGANKLAIIIPVIAAALALTSLSIAFFSDRETSVQNSFTAGEWVPTSTPIPTSTPTSTPAPTPTSAPTPASPVAGNVVINELMWMGSVGNSDDEWIELRNTAGQEIDLSGWQITKWVSGTHEELMITIPSGKTILANDYFLISNFNQANSAISVEPDLVDSSVVLTNSDLRIKLYKGPWTDSANLIDTADDGSGTPMAGLHGANKQSMERDDTPGDGTLSGSWHTCSNNACNDTTYWDTEGNNYGTPQAANL